MNPSASPPVIRRAPRNKIICVKVTEEEKQRLDKVSFDRDDTVSRIIRRALDKLHPEIFKNGK